MTNERMERRNCQRSMLGNLAYLGLAQLYPFARCLVRCVGQLWRPAILLSLCCMACRSCEPEFLKSGTELIIARLISSPRS